MGVQHRHLLETLTLETSGRSGKSSLFREVLGRAWVVCPCPGKPRRNTSTQHMDATHRKKHRMRRWLHPTRSTRLQSPLPFARRSGTGGQKTEAIHNAFCITKNLTKRFTGHRYRLTMQPARLPSNRGSASAILTWSSSVRLKALIDSKMKTVFHGVPLFLHSSK